MPLQTLKIRGLGDKGVISDLAPYDTDLGSWTNARNVRFTNGRAERMGGHLPVFYNNREESGALEFGGKPQVPMHLVLVPQTLEDWVYCTTNAIWLTDGWSHTNTNPLPVLRPDAVYKPDLTPEQIAAMKDPFEIDVILEAPWSSTTISNSIILNSVKLSQPIGLANGENNFTPLANWGIGTEWNATTIRSFKNFVIAVGGGDEYPQRVRWSNIVPPNALPADWGWKYQWSAQDEEKNPLHKEGWPIPVGDSEYGKFIDGSAGGYNDLSFAVGDLIDGKPLRDQFIIYTEEEVITCDYVGGNDIFRFRSLFDDGGALNPDCVASFDNKHFVVSAHDIYIHNGSTKESVIDQKVRSRLLEEITSRAPGATKVVPYLPANEIWVVYAGPEAEPLTHVNKERVTDEPAPPSHLERIEVTRAAVYNYKYGTWSFVDIPRTLDVKLGPIPFYDEAHVKLDTWEKLTESFRWEDSFDLWNLAGGESINDFKEHSLLCASSDGGFYVLDKGDYAGKLGTKKAGTKQYTILREEIYSNMSKEYIDLDEVTETIDYKTVLSIWPQLLGAGEVYIQVGGSHVPSGVVTWGSPVKYVCGKDRKVDLRQNYRYLSLLIQSRTAGTWSLSGLDIVVRIGGRR